METKVDKVIVDQLAVEAGSLEGNVTSLAMDMPLDDDGENKPKNLHGHGRIPR